MFRMQLCIYRVAAVCFGATGAAETLIDQQLSFPSLPLRLPGAAVGGAHTASGEDALWSRC